ncbi:hypothetical protein LEP1GSC125_1212 [Leptospira mayottensis 200901122]|uniref:Uncharacterized protein n=1 Tax=Leptospira mayottensis 200901122 TaxID=1193010 RepID=A0AA87MSU5_9LEPT|nr:hypothetical protein LEP1GSC125_1212 [Leptospira mayottensis 200901122]
MCFVIEDFAIFDSDFISDFGTGYELFDNLQIQSFQNTPKLARPYLFLNT